MAVESEDRFHPLNLSYTLHHTHITGYLFYSVNRFITCIFSPLAPPARMVSSHVDVGNFECTQSSICESTTRSQDLRGISCLYICYNYAQIRSHNVCPYILN